ncbi:ABC transporter substrate-binding protein [Spirochaeta dissipatitropha]
MNTTFRTIGIVFLMFLIVFPVFAGGGQERDSGVTRIRYANFSAGEENASTLRAMVDLFEAENPDIKIELESMGYGDNYFTALVTRIAGGDAPDVFELNMENFLAFAIRGAVRPLDELFVSTESNTDIYGEGLLDAVRFNNQIMAVPQSFSTVVLIYNKDLFDQAGVDYPTADWTWEESLEAAQRISSLGDDVWGAFNPIQFWEFYKVVQQNGGSLMAEDGSRFTINSPQNIATLQYMIDRVWKHKVMPDREQLANRPEGDLFVEGKLGMWLNGVWAFTDLRNRVSFPWGIEVEPGNTSKATHFFGNVAALSNSSKNPEAAFRFANFIASDPRAVQLRLDAQWELPTVADPAIMDQYISDTPPENKIAVVESLQYAVKPPALEQFSELTNIVNTLIEQARDGLISPKDALDRAQEEATARIRL